MSKPKIKTKKGTMLLKHVLTDDETLVYARQQSAALRDYTQAEYQLASVKADFKARMESLTNDMSMCARRIGDGFEMRDTEIITEFHVPEKGIKRISRMDTGEIIQEVRMRPEELQDELPLEDEAA